MYLNIYIVNTGKFPPPCNTDAKIAGGNEKQKERK
jgi:hypothetical protein